MSRRRHLAGFALAAIGYVVLAIVVGSGLASGMFPVTGGDVANYLAAGERLRAGDAAYVGAWDQPGTVYYAPPFIIAFAGLSFLPGPLVWAGLVALDIAGLRYISGSWTRMGWFALCPITGFQLVSGNPNFAIVAAMLLAHRRTSGPLAIAALAKLGPAAALPLHRWRAFAVWGGVAVAITIPWMVLWPQWVQFMLEAPPDGTWPTIVPLAFRLPAVAVLLLLRRPWAQMLAGCLAIPGFYVVTAWATIVLMASLFLGRRRAAAP